MNAGAKEGDEKKTWTVAACSVAALLVAWFLIGHFAKIIAPRSAQSGATDFIFWVLPLIFAVPVGWIAEDAGQAAFAFLVCIGGPLAGWSIIRGGGEIGIVFSLFIEAALLLPGSILGIGFGSFAKSVKRDGFYRPQKGSLLLLTMMLIPVFFATSYCHKLRLMHEQVPVRPLNVSNADLQLMALNAKPQVSQENQRRSAQYYLAGVDKFRKQNFKGAIAEWKMAATLNPENADAQAGLRRLGVESDHPANFDPVAQAKLTEPLPETNNQSQSSQQHYLSGVIYFEKGEYDKAKGEWTEAVKLDPENEDAQSGLKRINFLYNGGQQ